MAVTHFETNLAALDRLTDPQGVLGQEWVVHPPNPDYGYDSTPRNALTFGVMGVDGVHYAILTIDGAVSDDSPVIQISPMDFSDLYCVLGDTFITFLADSCGVRLAEMEAVFAAERSGAPALVPFLRERFDMERLWDDERMLKLKPLLAHVQLKE